MGNNHNPTQATSPSYSDWLKELKFRVQQVQTKAAIAVNRELLAFYWELGHQVVEKQHTTTWGSGFLKQLSADLSTEFPQIKGFSLRNLKYIRQWVCFYCPELMNKTTASGLNEVESIGQQAVAQLASKPDKPHLVSRITSVPWGHNIAIISKLKKKAHYGR